MTKQKSTKRALLLSALSLLMCVSMLIGSTFAWFTDSVISGNNKIVAGNLDIELEYYNGTEWKTVNGATNLFDETLWEPGHTDVVYLRLRNIGSLALKYELAINIVSETPGINVAGDEFLLSDYIYMGVVEDINGQTNPYSKDAAGRAKAIAEAAPATIISEGYAADGEMAKGANDLYMAVVVYMPSSVDNDANYRGDTAPSIDLGINLVATQLMNEVDSFGNDYDEAAKYVISSDEKMIFNGTEFDTLVTNNGTVDMTNAKIENDNTGFENYGDATLNGVTVNAGTPGTQAYGYAINAYAGSTTVLNDVVVNSANGAIGVTDGANLTFNSGSVDVDSKSTSGRYLFYVVGNGSTLTINGGNFDFNKTQNQKRAYIYAGAGTTVYVNGGTFGKASTRSGYTAGILGEGSVVITGGTFGFDPSAWVATGYKVVKNGNTWHVVAENVTAAVTFDDVKNAFATGGEVVLIEDIKLDDRLNVVEGKEVHLDMNGKTITVESGSSVDPAFYTYKDSTLVIDGNGTVILEDPSMSLLFPGGDVVIENGTFIRKVPAGTPSNEVGALIVGAKVSPWGSQTVTINGGYFDGGYYDANAADVDEILAGTKSLVETDADIANRGKSADKNAVRVAIKNNTQLTLNLSYNLFKIHGGTFVGVNPAWGDEGCMLPATNDLYLRPWSYYQGALLDGQEYNENGIVLPDGYTITKGAAEDGRPTYTVEYNK